MLTRHGRTRREKSALCAYIDTTMVGVFFQRGKIREFDGEEGKEEGGGRNGMKVLFFPESFFC